MLRWCLHSGWTGRLLHGRPQFDFTAALDPQALQIAQRQAEARLVGGDDPQALQSALYLQAYHVHHAKNAQARELATRIYCDLATQIARSIPVIAPPFEPAQKSNPFALADARNTLQAMAELLDGTQMPWYLVSGTFLGTHREGDFLSHDYDIDVGINVEHFDHDALIAGIMAAKDLLLVSISPYVHLEISPNGLAQFEERPALYSIMHSSGIEVDLFIHHKDGDQRWHGSVKHRWTNSDFDLTDYTISGLKVRGPADANRYLTENYGVWRIPVKAFNCSTGTPNVSFNHNLISVSQIILAAAYDTPQEAAIARTVLIQEGYLTETKGAWSFTVPWLPAA